MNSSDIPAVSDLSAAEAAPAEDTAAGLIVRDGSDRRQFLKIGAGYLLAGGAVVATPAALAADCDHGGVGSGSEKAPKQAQSGSDSDAGAEADPAGCGRRRHDTPKISRLDDDLPPGSRSVSVVRVRRN